MIRKTQHVLLQLIVFLLLLIPFNAQSQTLKGLVLDYNTSEPLAYVNIGVLGKNVGTISTNTGAFQIDLSKIGQNDKIRFSIIGYKSVEIEKPKSSGQELQIKLKPLSYEIPTVVVTENKKVETVKLGRYKPSKTTTGQSGIEEFGFGGELGIKVTYPGESYYLKDINFHTRFNTVDSVLFRVNVYEIEDGIPGKSKLQKEVFTKSYAKDKWITAHVLSHALKIEEDIIVTFELVRIWYSSSGSNHLFYTHGKGYPEGKSFSRESSFDKWSINKREPFAMFVTGILE